MSKTILLADDSVTIQKVVELTFMDEDYEIVAVSDGDSAITKLGEVTPSLVIADVHMPGASGYDVSRRVKQDHPGVPVLLLVGTFEPFDEGEADGSGADRHLKKPFDSQELLRLVEELIDGDAPTEPFAVDSLAGGEDATPEAPPVVDAPPAVETPVAVEAPSEADAQAAEPPTLVVPDDEPATTPGIFGETAVPDLPSPALELNETMDLSHAASALQTEESSAVEPEPAPDPEPPTAIVSEAPAPSPAAVPGELSDADVDRIARRVVELLGEDTVRAVSWEVVPDLAEVIIKERVRELESQVD